MLKFTEDHEWVKVEGDVATIGITTHATEQLGDIVFIELPELDGEFEAGATVAVVESVKAASDIYTPVTGTIVEANEAIADAPATVNDDPMGSGWFFKVRMSKPAEADALMDEAAYASYTAESSA